MTNNNETELKMTDSSTFAANCLKAVTDARFFWIKPQDESLEDWDSYINLKLGQRLVAGDCPSVGQVVCFVAKCVHNRIIDLRKRADLLPQTRLIDVQAATDTPSAEEILQSIIDQTKTLTAEDRQLIAYKLSTSCYRNKQDMPEGMYSMKVSRCYKKLLEKLNSTAVRMGLTEVVL